MSLYATIPSIRNETSSNIYHPVVREDEHDSRFSDPLPPRGDKQRKCLNKEFTFGLWLWTGATFDNNHSFYVSKPRFSCIHIGSGSDSD